MSDTEEGYEDYWKCVIGPISRRQVPDGADFPMRQAVKNAFETLSGKPARDCWSGWGNPGGYENFSQQVIINDKRNRNLLADLKKPLSDNECDILVDTWIENRGAGREIAVRAVISKWLRLNGVG